MGQWLYPNLSDRVPRFSSASDVHVVFPSLFDNQQQPELLKPQRYSTGETCQNWNSISCNSSFISFMTDYTRSEISNFWSGKNPKMLPDSNSYCSNVIEPVCCGSLILFFITKQKFNKNVYSHLFCPFTAAHGSQHGVKQLKVLKVKLRKLKWKKDKLMFWKQQIWA